MHTSAASNHIKQLGQRIERYRLLKNISQVDLAERAGIGERTLRRMESGKGGTVDTLIRVLVALQLDGNLEALVPDHNIRPMERARQAKSERLRASKSKRSRQSNTSGNKAEKQQPGSKNWTWGDRK